uniref:AC transposase n=1 Tax=Cajanus cajan TaxID=3821 RepID=A0A151QPW0_CAJCA|nr:Putative AC transposase [Cajanus cajan]
MLQSVLKYECDFGSLQLVDENYKFCPLDEEWEKETRICKVLQPFYETTTLISDTSYPTSNLYFLQVWKIQCLLMGSVTNEDKFVRGMVGFMMEKFEKYWDEYSILLAFGAILDPRIKLETLGYCYKRIDMLTWEIKLEKVKGKSLHVFLLLF